MLSEQERQVLDGPRSVTLARACQGKGEPRLRFSKARAGLEMAVALCAGILGISTIFWHDWIEALTGWDPDNRSGALEWIVVGGLLVMAVSLGLAARHHWRLLTAVADR